MRFFKNILTILIMGFIFISCSTDYNSNEKDDPQNIVENETDNTTVDDSENTTETPVVPEILANNSNIQYIGRVYFSDDDKASYTWPGVTIKAKFSGSEIDAVFSGSETYYSVSIDDNEPQIILVDSLVPAKFNLATKLTDELHTVTITKQNENTWDFEESVFYGFILGSDTVLIEPTPLPTRKIEFIGDSMITGYGNEKELYENPSLRECTNVTKAYAFLTASYFNAQVHVNAWSGRGLTRNWSESEDNLEEAFPNMWLRTIQSSDSIEWDFSWTPDIVFISLGWNDYSVLPGPDEDQFIEKYSELISLVRAKYGDVYIICSLEVNCPFENYIKDIVNSDQSGKLSWFQFPTLNNSGYHSHPDLEDHQNTSSDLIDFIENLNVEW